MIVLLLLVPAIVYLCNLKSQKQWKKLSPLNGYGTCS
jgi:hypothetical protein